MNVQTVGDILDFIAVPAATLFPFLYGKTAPWWKSLMGWAVITAKVGLALLVDAAAAFRIFGPDYPLRQYVLTLAFAVIVAGSWLYLIAFVRIRYRAYRQEASP